MRTWCAPLSTTSDVTAFAQTLAQASGENTRFLLATFGKEFTVLSEDLSGAELTDAAGSIAYTATQTRLNTSLDQALDYFAALPRSGNELRSIIVLSDAVQYDPQGGVSQESPGWGPPPLTAVRPGPTPRLTRRFPLPKPRIPLPQRLRNRKSPPSRSSSPPPW